MNQKTTKTKLLTKTKPNNKPKVETFFDRLMHWMSSPWARRIVLGLFVLQAVFLVFTIRIGTPPDENNHRRFIEYYANHSLSPILTDQQPTVNLGDKTREVDYLYHYTASMLYRVSPLSAHDTYMTIRLFTVFFALLCFVVLANVFRKLGVNDGAITAGLLILTNLPMVLMMSSVINNDVTVWLGMALGLLLLVRLWKQPSATDLLWLLALAVIGGLVKRELLPFGLVFGLVGLGILYRHFGVIFAQLKKFNWHIVAAGVVLLIGVALFTERIGGNVVRYGAVTPSCERVQGEAACYNFWASVRARELAKRPPEKPVPPLLFVKQWVWDSSYNIVDIQTQWWRHEVRPVSWLTPLFLWLLAIGLAYGFIYEKTRFAASQLSRHRVYAMLIGFYFIVVNLLVNYYGTYQHTKVYGIALNGRYVIPGVLLLGILGCFYWSKLLARYPKSRALLAVGIALATIFGSGLIMMLRNPQLYNG